MKLKVLWVIALIFLLSCTTTDKVKPGTVTLTPPNPEGELQKEVYSVTVERVYINDDKTVTVVNEEQVNVPVKSKCPRFVLPVVQQTPPLPTVFAEIENDPEAQKQLLLNHIKDLRKHISDVKTSVQQSYRTYTEKCQE